MANIHLVRQHSFTLEEMRSKIDLMMKSIEDKLAFDSEWENESEFYFRRKGANGRILISGDQLELNLNLGLMYRAMSAQIEKKIISAVNAQLNKGTSKNTLFM